VHTIHLLGDASVVECTQALLIVNLYHVLLARRRVGNVELWRRKGDGGRAASE
jgi:hypothetical protein